MDENRNPENDPDLQGVKEIDIEEFAELETRRIIIFLVLTFGITYLFEIGVIRPLVYSGNVTMNGIGQASIAAMMFIPSIGVLLTRFITKEGFKNVWIRPAQFKGNMRYYLAGWFGPVVLTIIGSLFYFLIFPDKFDGNMTFFAETYKAAGIEMSVDQRRITIAVQVLILIFAGPIINAATCFGEEWGWRGYLLPKMKEKLPVIPMLLVNGVIWGLWHAPLTVMGHNYGTEYWGYPITGILAMCCFCIVMGTLFSYITLKAGSCIPAVMAHASINGFAAIGIYFTEAGGNPFIGPVPTGIAGGAAFIAAAAVIMVLMVKDARQEMSGEL
ncbi:CPBP family intramembrane glutamic endopeptidase [Anaerobium acetethylicum]|uniref:Membrane protease YdiL, CAAX protease family n=1 Tax=Anaerobium acetethylicum TaxID=1619234 RepID=A0A1D3TQ63_9FIRM|nr:type II CAAX endopeptidase family protein [Anaerobium acetethylicum]SCP95646.1 Membrane protease YdiL, CAAX protease family [Anaerobium acetethylicum]